MPELKRILELAGGHAWRGLLVTAMAVLAFSMLAISALTATTAENNADEWLTKAIQNSGDYPAPIEQRLIPIAVKLFIVGLPILVAWFLKEHAFNEFWRSLNKAKTAAWEYFRGKNDHRGSAVLWTVLQLDLALLFPFGALAGAVNTFLPLPSLEEIVAPRSEVRYIPRYIPQSVTQRIQFEKPGLRPDDRFETIGSDLPGGMGEVLQNTVRELRGDSGCHASVSVQGFASDEEFRTRESDWKNLELADHRAEAVHRALLSLHETQNGTLTVDRPELWAPAIKPDNPQRLFNKMQDERNDLVPSDEKGDRNAAADRVVILQWTLKLPCGSPTEAEETLADDNS